MDSKETELGQEPQTLSDGLSGESEVSQDVEALRAENERLWQAVVRYAPQIVNLLAEHKDAELLADVAKRLAISPDHQAPPRNDALPAAEPFQEAVSELAKQVVDSIFDSGPARPVNASPGDDAASQREAGRLEEYVRQQAVRRGVVEQGTSERREPTITLDPKGKEIAQALGISEEKLALAAAERLRQKGVLRT